MEDRAISLNAVIDALNLSINIFEAEDRIRDLPIVTSTWIKIENDKDIDLDHEVLCCDKYGSMLIGWLSRAYYGDYECNSDDAIMFDPIAYMELPEPYKAESEDKE